MVYIFINQSCGSAGPRSRPCLFLCAPERRFRSSYGHIFVTSPKASVCTILVQVPCEASTSQLEIVRSRLLFPTLETSDRWQAVTRPALVLRNLIRLTIRLALLSLNIYGGLPSRNPCGKPSTNRRTPIFGRKMLPFVAKIPQPFKILCFWDRGIITRKSLRAYNVSDIRQQSGNLFGDEGYIRIPWGCSPEMILLINLMTGVGYT